MNIQFGLKSVLLVTALLALITSLIFLPALKQGNTVEALENEGVFVGVERPSGWRELLLRGFEAVSSSPNEWGVTQRNNLGVPDYVHYHHSGLDDQTLGKIASLNSIQSITYDDIDFFPLGNWPIAKYGEHRVTDRGLACLAELPKLGGLTLRSDQITDKGMEALAKCPELVNLSLECPQLTDDGLLALSQLKLESLNLDAPLVTDEGLRSLANMQSISSICDCLKSPMQVSRN